VRLWSLHSGKCLYHLTGHTDWVRCVAFSPSSQLLASASADLTARLWNVATGKCLGILQGHVSAILSIAFSVNGQTLATSSSDNTIRLWDVETRTCLRIFLLLTNCVFVEFTAPSAVHRRSDQKIA